MPDIMKRDSLITTEEKLLFDILHELKEINQKLTAPAKPEPARPIAKATKEKAKTKGTVTRKQCGKQFDNRGKFFQHMKKEHKKEEK